MQYVAPYRTGHPPVNYNYSQEHPSDTQPPHQYQPHPNYHQNLSPQNLAQCKPDPAAFEQHNNYEQQNYSSPPPNNFEQHTQNNYIPPSSAGQVESEGASMVYGDSANYTSQEPVQSPAPSMEPPTPQVPPPVETQYSDSDSGSDYDPKQDGISKVKVEPKKEEGEDEIDEDEEEVGVEPTDDDSDSDYIAKKSKARKRKRAPPKQRQTRQSSNTVTTPPSRATRSAKGKKTPAKKEKEEDIDIVEEDVKESLPAAPVKKEPVNELSNQVQVLFLPSEGDPPNVVMLKKRLLELAETDIEKSKKLKLFQNLTWRQKKEIQKLKDEIKKLKGRTTQNSNNASL